MTMRGPIRRSEEHTSELQSQSNLVCRLLLEKKKTVGLFLSAPTRRGDLRHTPPASSSVEFPQACVRLVVIGVVLRATVAAVRFFFLMIRRPPRSTLFPTRRSSDLRMQSVPRRFPLLFLAAARQQPRCGVTGLSLGPPTTGAAARASPCTLEWQPRYRGPCGRQT